MRESGVRSLLAVRWRVGQAIPNVVFSVTEALTVLAIIARLLPPLRADAGDPRNGNLNAGLAGGLGLSEGWCLRKCACEQQHGERGNLIFMVVTSQFH
jgi:hypothetical protein